MMSFSSSSSSKYQNTFPNIHMYLTCIQGCGSAFIFCGSGSSSQSWSGSSFFFNADPEPEGKWMRILANPDPQPSLHCKTKYRRNKKCPTWGSSWPRPWWAVCRPWAAWGRWTCPPRWAPRWPLGSSCQYQTQHSWTAVAGSGSWS